MKLAIHKKGLDKDLDALKELNEDLRELSRQIRDFKKGQKRRSQALADRQAIKKTFDLSGFQTIRKTSENLYQALARVSSCLAHEKHSATLCVDARSLGKSHNPRVKFNMAFCASMNRPVWIDIESTIDENSAQGINQLAKSDSDARPLVACLKRHAESFDVQTTTLAKILKVAKPEHKDMNNASLIPAKGVQELAYNELLSSYRSIPNLSFRNFCSHIERNAQNPTSSTDFCAGFFREGTCEHLLYLPPKSFESNSKTLAQILSSPSQDLPQVRYTRVERVRLAKLLATAVLEYHNTPWLQESWRSQDIKFFTGTSQPMAALDAPHLSVCFPNKNMSPQSTQDQSIAQNGTLFGLATILLELDFEKPLSHMRLPTDVVENSSQDTEFKTAKRLARSTIPGLGPDFRKIVRKCLHCNFGIDETDLTKSEELKSKIHEEVICGLEDLERALADCTLVQSRI